MLKFKCRDVGLDCGFTAKGKTEDEILAQCAAHTTKKDHNMKPEDITGEFKSKINANIYMSWF
jgi:predicted small metal-binding protein